MDLSGVDSFRRGQLALAEILLFIFEQFIESLDLEIVFVMSPTFCDHFIASVLREGRRGYLIDEIMRFAGHGIFFPDFILLVVERILFRISNIELLLTLWFDV